MLQMTSTSQMLAAIDRSHAVTACAYTLRRPVLNALEAAARRGERVVVRLEGTPFADPKGHLAGVNLRLVKELRSAGVDAATTEFMHAKTFVVDGELYLDNRNWGKDDLVLRETDPAQAAKIPMRKIDALAQEAALLRSASGDAIVETESFGRYNAVSAALDALGRAGKAPRLLVSDNDLRGNARERAALERLVADGVRVRVCKDSEKFALTGDGCWMGSANATPARPDSHTDLIDWGVRVDQPDVVAAVRARVEANWTRGKDLGP